MNIVAQTANTAKFKFSFLKLDNLFTIKLTRVFITEQKILKDIFSYHH